MKDLCLASGGLWGVGQEVQGSLLALEPWAPDWPLGSLSSPSANAPCRAALGGAQFSALSNWVLICCCCRGWKNRVTKFCRLIIEWIL